MLLVDIPNQVQAKNLFLRGWCYSRQAFVREYEPFEWKTTDKLKKRYEEPLKMLTVPTGSALTQKQRITLEYLRDEDVDALPKEASAFEREKNKVRKILLGNCKLMDSKMEKNAAYEITPAVRLI